jgi:hypothetical protein
MHIIPNERRIRVSRAVGQYGTMAGFLALLGGLIISFAKPEWLVVLVACLISGYTLSVMGGFFSDRYVGPLAHHDALAKALKGLDNRYVLLHYVLPAAHVLLEPSGCTVFVVKTQGGQISYQEDGRWKHRQKGKFFRQFVGQEALGAPGLEAQRQAHKLERWLSRHLPDPEVPVRAAIVFVNPDVTLDADASPVPALHAKKLKAWLRGPGTAKPLSDAVHRELADAFGIENGEQ